MVTKLYLDTRRTIGSAPAPLKLSVALHSKVMYISLDIKVPKAQWDAKAQKAKNLALNLQIQERKRDIDEYIYNKVRAHAYDGKELPDIIEDVRTNFRPNRTSSHLVKTLLEECIKGKSANTVICYRTAFKRLGEMCDLDHLSCDDFTLPFINKFDSYLQSRGLSPNTRHELHVKVGRVINYAFRMGITKQNNYALFSVKKTKTKHRAMTREQLQALRDAPFEREISQRHRDLYMLVFYLIGINTVDLFNLKKTDMRAGRIVYTRAKTHKEYSILVQPEAKQIIDRYAGSDEYLLDLHTRYTSVSCFKNTFNHALKRLAPDIDGFSSYWARHTWATLAFRAGVSKTDVSLALGHSLGGSFITDIYIDYMNDDIIDAANRKVLDYIL